MRARELRPVEGPPSDPVCGVEAHALRSGERAPGGSYLLWQSVSRVPTSYPWEAVLETGRDEELVATSREREQSGLAEPSPRVPASRAARGLVRGGNRGPLGASGRDSPGRPPRARDRHHGHRERQVAGLQPPRARHAGRRSLGARVYLYPTKALAQDQARALAASAGATCVTRSTTATPRKRSAAPSAGARTCCSPTRTCCTWACCPTTAHGATCWPTSPGWWLTRPTSTAVCSGRTWPTCCVACGGWPAPTGPSRASCSRARRSPTPPSWRSGSPASTFSSSTATARRGPSVRSRCGTRRSWTRSWAGGRRRCPRPRTCSPASWSARCARSASSTRDGAWS